MAEGWGRGDYSREAIIFVYTQEWIEVMCEWFKYNNWTLLILTHLEKTLI